MIVILFPLKSWNAHENRYIYSAYAINKAINNSSIDSRISSPNPKNSNIHKTLLLIKRFAICYVFLLSIWLLFLIIGSVQYQNLYKKSWKEDEIATYMFFFDIGFLFAITATLFLVKFIHDAARKQLSKSKGPKSEENYIANSGAGASVGVVIHVMKADQTNIE